MVERLKGVIAAVDILLAQANDDRRIIPGHGALASRQDLVAYRDMLATVQARLGALKAAGERASEALTEAPLDDLEAEWGDGNFNGDRWIALFYDVI